MAGRDQREIQAADRRHFITPPMNPERTAFQGWDQRSLRATSIANACPRKAPGVWIACLDSANRYA
jgi:hypothetical protein